MATIRRSWTILAGLMFWLASGVSAKDPQLTEVVREAFAATHEGYSSDEVVLDDRLNRAFIAACRKKLPDAAEAELNWTLFNLRKAGKLDTQATKRRTLQHDEYLHAAEIAARFVQDKFEHSTDRIMCDPVLRAEFDRVARSLAPQIEPYRLRKAALGLRKARKLSPELVTRVANWGRQVVSFPAEQLREKPETIPERPGVYLFRDETGYLYIGESSQLRQRLKEHLTGSDRKTLAAYLADNGVKNVTIEMHVFDPQSEARLKPQRRAYESELIRSRKPRFNVAP